MCIIAFGIGNVFCLIERFSINGVFKFDFNTRNLSEVLIGIGYSNESGFILDFDNI